MNAIRRNDTVLVIAGKDRGKTGVVRSVLTKKGRVIVDGVNMIKKHQRPTQSQGTMVPGGIVTREAAHARLERDGGVLGVPQGRPHRHPRPPRRRQGPCVQAMWSGH